MGVLLDCGPGSLPMMKRLGYSPSGVDVVLISHLHGDHFAGVPFLLLEFQYLSPRTQPLTIAGPPGTANKVKQLTKLLFPGLDPKPHTYDLRLLELESGQTEAFGPTQVTPFRVRHFPDGTAYGFRLHMDGRTLVYSGDTGWTNALARHSEGADLLICECSTFAEKTDYHMSHRELVQHHEQIRARRVMLIHAGDDVLARRWELMFDLAEEGQEVFL